MKAKEHLADRLRRIVVGEIAPNIKPTAWERLTSSQQQAWLDLLDSVPDIHGTTSGDDRY